MLVFYLWFAEAGGHEAARSHIQVPLLPALVVRIQSINPPVQGADDHQRPADRTKKHTHGEQRTVEPSSSPIFLPFVFRDICDQRQRPSGLGDRQPACSLPTVAAERIISAASRKQPNPQHNRSIFSALAQSDRSLF